MQNQFGITVREMLDLKVFEHTKIIVGAKGLEKPVSNINIMEVPDILNWVKPGELLATTGYAICNDPICQEELIPGLIQKGVVGLAIKTKRYLNEIPAIMVEQARQNDFVLLELSSEVVLYELINALLVAKIEKQNEYVSRSLQSHNLFMEIVLKGGRLQDMANSLSQLIENTVLIYDSKHEELAYCLYQWDEEKQDSLLDNARRVFDNKKAPPGRELTRFRSYQLWRVNVPIISGNENYGSVLVYETNKKTSFSDTEIIERFSTVAALQIINQYAAIQMERRYANEFIDLLLFANIDLESEYIERGRFLGWDLSKSYVAILLQYQGNNDLEKGVDKAEQTIDISNHIYKGITDYCHRSSRSFILSTKSDRFVLILEVSPTEQWDQCGEMLSEVKKLRQALLFTTRDGTLTTSMGRYYPGIRGIKKSYKEALKALNIGEQIGLQGKDIHFERLGVYRLLALIEKQDDMAEFLHETVQPLFTYDREKNSDLVKTLEVYFTHQGNMKKVSQALFTHYNTVLYRIERIQEITRMSLEDPDDRLKLEIALKICKMVKE